MAINIQLAAMRSRLPVGSYSVILRNSGEFNDTGFSAHGSIDFYFQARNRAGVNLQSDKVTVDYLTGQAIEIVFNSNAIASGEEVFALVVSADTTGNREAAVQLAVWYGREFDQVTKRSLPASIWFTRDSHLDTTTQVATSGDLPGGDDLLPGRVAFVAEDIETYVYEPDAPDGVYPATGKSGYWLINPFVMVSFIDDLYEPGAAYTSLDLLESQLPGLPKLAGQDSTPIGYWIANDLPEDSGSSILPGSKYQFEFSVDGMIRRDEYRTYNSLFAGLVNFKILGLVRLATGTLYSDVSGAGITYTWNPGLNQILEVPTEVYPGYALAFEIWFTSQSDRLLDSGLIRPGQDIRLNDIYQANNQGGKSDLWYLTGDCILPQDDRLRVVPSQILPGQALIAGYRIPIGYPKPITNLLIDTPDQIVAISAARNGDVNVRQSFAELDETEAARAMVSTAPGYAYPSAFSDPVSLNAGQKLILDITLPLTTNLQAIIRSDYSDSAIAGLEGQWNSPQIRIFLLVGAVIYYKKTLVDSSNVATLSVEISDLVDFEQIAFIPQPSDPSFGLFGYGAIAIATATDSNSTLVADTYSYCIQWVYPSPNTEITAISHDETLGLLPEKGNIFANDTKYWNEPILTIAEARAIKGEDLKPGRVWTINTTRRYIPYVYDPNVQDADNGISVIKPDILTNTTGALVPLRTLGHRIVGEGGLLPARHNIRFQGATTADDPINNASVVIIPPAPPPVTETSSLLVASTGEILTFHEDIILDWKDRI